MGIRTVRVTQAILMILCALALPAPLQSITFVYNLRIGETTRARNTAFGALKNSVVALTPLGQFRSFDTDFHQSAGGVLGNYIYATDSWYARINAAAGRVHANGAQVEEFGKVECDDILFTGGYSWELNQKTRITLSGHFGVPLHSDYIADLVQLGTGHVGLGLQLDGLYAFNVQQALLVAARIICFLPRDVTVQVEEKKLCIPHFHLGDAVDLLISYQHSFGNQRHMIGVGYNPTFTFGTDDITATEKRGQLHTTMNSLFATYRYAFPINDMLSAVIVGLSYGFLNVPAPLNHGNSATVWFTWGINF